MSLKLSQASFASRFSNFALQSISFRYCLMPTMSALFQFGLVDLTVSLNSLIFRSILRMQWSLLPILPSSLIEITLSGQFVITKSRIIPLMWVGKSTSWARSSSTVVSRILLPLAAEVPSSQLMSGRLTSPIRKVLMSIFFRMLHSCSELS